MPPSLFISGSVAWLNGDASSILAGVARGVTELFLTGDEAIRYTIETPSWSTCSKLLTFDPILSIGHLTHASKRRGNGRSNGEKRIPILPGGLPRGDQNLKAASSGEI